MIALTYLSRATTPLEQDELEDLLVMARRSNQARGVTGLLLYADRQFIQTLEGERPTVEATMRRIAADPRHHDVEVVFVEDVAQRSFPDWSMGFRLMAGADVARLPGFNDYLARRGDQPDDKPALGHAEVFHRAFRALAPDLPVASGTESDRPSTDR